MPELAPVAVTRLLGIVTWLGRRRGRSAPLGELAAHFGRSRRQMRRDLGNLDDVRDSLPGSSFEITVDEGEDGEDAVVSLRRTPGVEAPPRLRSAEAAAILVGLAALSDSLGQDQQELITSTALAVHRLSGVLPVGAIRTVPSPAVDAGEREALALVREALAARVSLRILYRSPGREPGWRLVDPIDLDLMGDGWVLRAWCHEAGAERAFRLDRIEEAEVTAQAMTSRVTTPRESTHRSFIGEPPTVRLTVRPGARWLLDRAPVRLVEETEESLVIDLPVWNRDWVADLLIDAAPDLLDVSDAGLADLMRARARRALEAWGWKEEAQ